MLTMSIPTPNKEIQKEDKLKTFKDIILKVDKDFKEILKEQYFNKKSQEVDVLGILNSRRNPTTRGISPNSQIKEVFRGGNVRYIRKIFPAFKDFYEDLGIDIPKSLEFYKNEDLNNLIENSSLKDPIFKRFDSNLLKIKTRYFNNKNYNFIFLDNGRIYGTSYQKIKKEITQNLTKAVMAVRDDKEQVKEFDSLHIDSKVSFTPLHDELILNVRANFIIENGKTPVDLKVKVKIPYNNFIEEISPSKLLNNVFDKVKPHESEAVKNLYEAYLNRRKEKLKDFKIIEGDLVSYFYHKDRYTKDVESSMLHKSCMRTANSVSFYSMFPSVLKMLALFDKKGRIKGRCLFWKAIPEKYYDSFQKGKISLEELKGKEEYVMDRVYYDTNDTANLFSAYALENGYKTSYISSDNVGIKPDRYFVILPNIKLKDIESLDSLRGNWPYMDSFSAISSIKDSIVLTNFNGRGFVSFEEAFEKEKKKLNTPKDISNLLETDLKNSILKSIVKTSLKTNKIKFKIGDKEIEFDIGKTFKPFNEESITNIVNSEFKILSSIIDELYNKDLISENKIIYSVKSRISNNYETSLNQILENLISLHSTFSESINSPYYTSFSRGSRNTRLTKNIMLISLFLMEYFDKTVKRILTNTELDIILNIYKSLKLYKANKEGTGFNNKDTLNELVIDNILEDFPNCRTKEKIEKSYNTKLISFEELEKLLNSKIKDPKVQNALTLLNPLLNFEKGDVRTFFTEGLLGSFVSYAIRLLRKKPNNPLILTNFIKNVYVEFTFFEELKLTSVNLKYKYKDTYIPLRNELKGKGDSILANEDTMSGFSASLLQMLRDEIFSSQSIPPKEQNNDIRYIDLNKIYTIETAKSVLEKIGYPNSLGIENNKDIENILKKFKNEIGHLTEYLLTKYK